MVEQHAKVDDVLVQFTLWCDGDRFDRPTDALAPFSLHLRGVDGLVFVADSQYDKMSENVDSFTNLEDNLRALKLNLADIPYVLQYNKRDLPGVAPVEYMDFLLNNRDVQVPSFDARGTSGAVACVTRREREGVTRR